MATRFFPRYDKNLIISRFGMRKHPILKINTMHYGIDINATNDGKTGQTDYITAHTGGTVEAVGYGVSAGNYVKIRVDHDTLMVYYHMKNPCTLRKGDKVRKGDKLGYVGKTGSATGPHLHFGIQFDGEWIDPEPYLDADWVQPVSTCTVELPILKNGDKGDAVKAMQILLAGYGYKGEMKESAYGSFGSKTENAVNFYRKSYGMEQNGKVDEQMWQELLGGGS